MSDISVEDFLSHHGVKGQKWGIRNAKVGGDGETTITFRGRTHVRNNRTQSRAARNGKRVVAAMLGGPVGLIAYNALSAPLNEKSAAKMAKKRQSGAAYVAKLVAVGVLATPLTAIAYAQIAKPVRKKNSENNSVAGKKVSSKQANKMVTDFLKKNPTGRDEAYFKKAGKK